jgi:predicted flap endonuclease-1-like 5' DNA nuclease
MPSIGQIEGLDSKSATKLRKAGIRTTEGLLKVAASKRQRSELADLAGVDAEALLGWVQRADLMRIKGIGGEYAELLDAVGVSTIRALRRRNPGALAAAISEINDRKRIVRRLPTDSMVVQWVALAKDTEPIVGG